MPQRTYSRMLPSSVADRSARGAKKRFRSPQELDLLRQEHDLWIKELQTRLRDL